MQHISPAFLSRTHRVLERARVSAPVQTVVLPDARSLTVSNGDNQLYDIHRETLRSCKVRCPHFSTQWAVSQVLPREPSSLRPQSRASHSVLIATSAKPPKALPRQMECNHIITRCNLFFCTSVSSPKHVNYSTSRNENKPRALRNEPLNTAAASQEQATSL